jgi:hypothetical protein
MAMTARAMTAQARRVGMARMPRVEPFAALLLLFAVLGGLALVLAGTPIGARGDYGQWLMTSRFYLGQDVPDYRTISALPPVIPLFLALVQVVIPDPVGALQAANVMLMAGLGLSFFLAGLALGRRVLAGLFAVVIGLLVTDRYLELFAFGGLLQAGSVMFTSLSVAAFVRAGRGPQLERRWWAIGSVSLALAALSHVGAGTVAVPIGLSVAGIGLFRLRRLGWRELRHALVPVLIGLGAIAVYWLVVLLPASQDYVTNPASLGYRGPERLFRALFEFWPTGMVIVIGMAAVAVGSLTEVLRRTVDRYLILLAWTAVSWGALLGAVVTGAATDYPRFAPVLLTPLVLASAFALLGLTRWFGLYLHAQAPRSRPSAWVLVAAGVVVVAAIPFAVSRYERQAATYQPRDAEALTEAVLWVNQALPDPNLAVLTAVRDGKWLEGLTGREALFSLPVRYAFRPVEWQRSVDADALLRSTAAMTNEYFYLKFTGEATAGAITVPTSLLLGANHGGEYVELLRLPPSATRIYSADGQISAAQLTPVDVRREWTESRASIRTDWLGMAGTAQISLVRTVRLWQDGATMRLIDSTSGTGIENVFSPPAGMSFTSLEITGREAKICFTRIGTQDPCLRIFAGQADAVMEPTAEGGLRIRTAGSSRLDVLVTTLTASGPSVGLGVLDPGELIATHQVGAALMLATDPSFAFRRDRLTALGFHVAHTSGPYAVLVRDDLVLQGQP